MRAWVWLVAAVALTGCSNAGQNGGGQAASTATPAASNSHEVKGLDGTEGEIVGTIIPGSKFSRVQIGMHQQEVENLIGQASDMDSHITGKSFIPFYFGGDAYRQEAFYKGEGILTYSPSHFAGSANTLIRIIVDPAETGHAH